MKAGSKIIISLDKQFYSGDDEIKIHIWFNHAFFSPAILTVLSPTGRKIDSASLNPEVGITETFAFTCGGPFMFENGYYMIRVERDNFISESMFEYYNSKSTSHPNTSKFV